MDDLVDPVVDDCPSDGIHVGSIGLNEREVGPGQCP